jgi:hypothetical protein
MFKDYSKSRQKPPQYAKTKQVHHEISEYLSPRQKSMMKERKGPTTRQNSFSKNWSGYDKNQGRPAVSRRMLRGTDELSNLQMMWGESGFQWSDFPVMPVAFVLFTVLGILNFLRKRCMVQK